MNIRGIYKTSLIDYPGKICAVLFTGGCNLRCKFCHNPDLVLNNNLEFYSNEKSLDLLKKRKNLIDGVTITGGEPTLSENIDSFIGKIKELSLYVKLDSNGLKPGVIERLIKNNLVDYAAIDIKTSPVKYKDITNRDIDFSKIVDSINILKDADIDYEIRTTCIPGFITVEDFESINKAIGSVKRYYLQQFVNDVPLLDESWRSIQPYSVNVLNEFKDYVKTFSEICAIRGIL